MLKKRGQNNKSASAQDLDSKKGRSAFASSYHDDIVLSLSLSLPVS